MQKEINPFGAAPAASPFPVQPVPQYQPALHQSAPSSGSGLATASVVLGCIGLLMAILPILGFPVTIIGLVLGIKGKSTPGTILCIIGLVLSVINMAIGAYMGATRQLF